MSLSVLFAQNHEVLVLDIDPKRVDQINRGKSTILDQYIDECFEKKNLKISATLDKSFAYKSAHFIVIATPTNYDPDTNRFDTDSVDSVISDALDSNDEALIVIKSTIPVGHTKFLQERFNTKRIIFSPEFLREGKALLDNLYPSRIVVGGECHLSVEFSDLLKEGAIKEPVETLFMESTEAEAVKLFANTYLAMRVSFFNELDTFCYLNNLDAKNVIKGVSSDERIGDYYNNPSFGYGGYCLPKDTKQLLANYKEIPQEMIQAIVKSNETRITFLANEIVGRVKSDLGVYRLSMKSGSDNYRSSSIIKVIEKIREISPTFAIKIYEPSINSNSFMHCEVVDDLNDFKKKSDLIITNRLDKELNDVKEKVFTRDIFHNN